MDSVARLIGERLATRLGQVVNVIGFGTVGLIVHADLPARHVRELIALAVASRNRSPVLPDVPTMAKAGLPGYESATNYTLFVPARTPAEGVAQLNRETNAVLKRDDVIEWLSALGIVITGGSTEAAQFKMASVVEKWAGVIRCGNITLG